MKVLLFSRSLNAGGAERQLVLLAKALHARGIAVSVMVFYGDGEYRSELEAAGVPVIDLQKSGRWDVFGFGFRMVRSVRQARPDVIYSLMVANIIVVALKPLLGNTIIVWGVRSSDIDLSEYDGLTKVFDRLAVCLSRFADAVICNSERGRKHVRYQGYTNEAIHVIPNGIDIVRYSHQESSRLEKRAEWQIPEDAPVIGVMARIDAMKDHATILRAFKQVQNICANARLVCVGAGNSKLRDTLMQQTISLNLQQSVMWVGHSKDPVKEYSAFDVLVSSSLTEAFPNVIGEAMACGLPVVATDVGDCRRILGDCGWIVPSNSCEALASAIGKAIENLPMWRPERSRERVEENYGVNAMVDSTLKVLRAAVKP